MPRTCDDIMVDVAMLAHEAGEMGEGECEVALNMVVEGHKLSRISKSLILSIGRMILTMMMHERTGEVVNGR